MHQFVRLVLGLGFVCGLVAADPIRVQYLEGTEHGFLALRSPEGKILASGDLVQVLRGNRVTAHLVFRFKDGSLSDETSVFTQRTYFRLLTDHLIQKGPAFPQSSDVLINTQTGEVRVKYAEHDQEKVKTSHLDLPPDLANGIILNVVKNISPKAEETTISYLAATPKPKLVKMVIKPEGKEPFSVAGTQHEAMKFAAKIEIGGIEGLLAPLIGKQPPDIHVWVAGGEAPAFVKSECPLFLGGPNWTIEMTNAVWTTGEAEGR